MRSIFVMIACLAALILSGRCKPRDDHNVASTSDTAISVRTVECLSDSAQTYCIALPCDYDTGNRYPVVYVFDPHGNGELAVNTFRAGASEFGYIVAGSNVIRNGYEKTEYALQALTRDVLGRYAVDPYRQYAAGFSGGGRVAQLFTRLNANVKAIASAGAGYSPGQTVLYNKASMLFIAGDGDFNYHEIVSSDKALSSAGMHHFILEYPGKHDWPAPEIVRDVLWWFEFDAYRRDPSIRQKTIIRSYMASVKQQSELLEESKDPFGAVQNLEKGIAFLTGIARTTSFQKKRDELVKSPEYKHFMRQKQKAMMLEKRLQQGYMIAFRDKDTLWWSNEIDVLNEKTSRLENAFMRPVYSRIRSFISIAAYSFCNRALMQHDLINAERYISIYRIIDPGNPDVYYFHSVLLSASGQVKASREQFGKAVSLGFSDWKKAQAELPEKVNSISP
ncbi:MAG: hypothetical protein JW973_02290 [Bacteroidales bacterium]|nr:hypothetical protein [Bacteroidales bacterium]